MSKWKYTNNDGKHIINNERGVLIAMVCDEDVAIRIVAEHQENERLRKELEELRNFNEGIRRVATYWHESFVEARKIILPRQPDRQGGWDIDFNFLQTVQQIIDIEDEDRQFDHIVLEEIQVTLLALEKGIDQGKLPNSNPDEVQLSCMDFELIKK